MNAARPIVVTTNLSMETRNDGKMYAAHLEELGLTAYERTPEKARERVFDLFNQFVNLHRAEGAGVLEQRLADLGVQYEWMDQYAGELPVLDTREPSASQRATSPSSYSELHGKSSLAA